MEYLLKGIVFGLSIAAPVGPIGILCIRKTLVHGRLHGFISGLGAATADLIYGTIAAFGFVVIINIFLANSFWVTLMGSIFLLYLAFSTYRSRNVKTLNEELSYTRKGLSRTYITTLFLTLANPMTIVLFISLFAGLDTSQDTMNSLLLVIGVFFGSLLWWFSLSFVVGYTRKMITPRTVVWINVCSSLVLLFFSLLGIIKVIMNSAFSSS